MIQPFVNAWMSKKEWLMRHFKLNPPVTYQSVVSATVSTLLNIQDDMYDTISSSSADHVYVSGREILGSEVYIIRATDGNPTWFIYLNYGSCLASDTLKRIIAESHNEEDYLLNPSNQQLNDLLTLSMHLVQSIKRFDEV